MAFRWRADYGTKLIVGLVAFLLLFQRIQTSIVRSPISLFFLTHCLPSGPAHDAQNLTHFLASIAKVKRRELYGKHVVNAFRHMIKPMYLLMCPLFWLCMKLLPFLVNQSFYLSAIDKSMKTKVSESDQDIPQSQTADQPTTP